MSPPLAIVPLPPVALPPPPPPSLAKKGPPGKKMQFRSAKWQKTADSKYKKVSDEYSLPAPPKALPPPPGPSLAKKGPPGLKMQQRSAKWTQISAKKWQKISPEYSLPAPPELPQPGWKPPPKPQKVVVKRQVSQKIRDAWQMLVRLLGPMFHHQLRLLLRTKRPRCQLRPEIDFAISLVKLKVLRRKAKNKSQVRQPQLWMRREQLQGLASSANSNVLRQK